MLLMPIVLPTMLLLFAAFTLCYYFRGYNACPGLRGGGEEFLEGMSPLRNETGRRGRQPLKENLTARLAEGDYRAGHLRVPRDRLASRPSTTAARV